MQGIRKVNCIYDGSGCFKNSFNFSNKKYTWAIETLADKTLALKVWDGLVAQLTVQFSKAMYLNGNFMGPVYTAQVCIWHDPFSAAYDS